MSIEVKAETVIDVERSRVAKIMFNPKTEKLWMAKVREVYPMQSGQFTEGAKVERIGDFLNKRYSCKLVVTKFEVDRMVQMFCDEPFEMNMRYELSDADGGTNVKVSVMSVGEILFNSPISIVSAKMQDNLEADLQRLKQLVEETASDND